MSKLDLTKPYRTREGQEAGAMPGPDGRLYGWLRDDNSSSGFNELLSQDWNASGLVNDSGKHHPWDLVNIPEKRTFKGWSNIYRRSGPDLISGFYETKAIADRHRTPDCVACIEREITYTVGEGLEP